MVPDRRFPNRGSGGKTEKLDMADYKNINIRNKRATFDYEIIEEWIAGIVLVGKMCIRDSLRPASAGCRAEGREFHP